MNLKELKAKRNTLQKTVLEIEAQNKMNLKQLKKIEAEILEKTGLKSLDKLEEYLARLESELNTKRDVLSEQVAELDAQLAEIVVSKEEEDIDEI